MIDQHAQQSIPISASLSTRMEWLILTGVGRTACETRALLWYGVDCCTGTGDGACDDMAGDGDLRLRGTGEARTRGDGVLRAERCRECGLAVPVDAPMLLCASLGRAVPLAAMRRDDDHGDGLCRNRAATMRPMASSCTAKPLMV